MHSRGENKYQSRAKKKKSNTKIKSSFGIACCRTNAKQEIEILLVCKRYTYAFCEFVNFNYNINSDKDILALLRKMTIDEKLDILSMNYSQMWYRVWLSEQKYYMLFLQHKNQFDSIYLYDGGAHLRDLVAQTLSSNEDRIWEIPKGRRDDKTENNLICAMREFREETGIKKRHYTLLHENGFSNDYMECGVLYKNKYFLAAADKDLDIKKCLSIEQLGEISDIRWMTLDKIKVLDTDNRLMRICRTIFKKYKSLMKL